LAEDQGHREIEVIPPSSRSPNNSVAPLANAIGGAIESLMHRGGLSMAAIPRDIDYEDLDDASKKIVDAFMEQMRPEIEEKAKALLTAEIRDRIVKKADLAGLGKALRKGKKLSLKRKRGCIFVQFGTGEPDDPIDEFLLAST